jgi:CubicO group peptidase (beta-lactamase class C family)
MLTALAAVRALDYEPGSSYAYSNIGYICLAAIVERTSSLTLHAFARLHVFDPLGMTRSAFWSGRPRPRLTPHWCRSRECRRRSRSETAACGRA